MSDQHVSIAGGSVVVGKPNDGVQPVPNGEQAVPMENSIKCKVLYIVNLQIH